METRRAFALPEIDQQFLDTYGLPWVAIQDGSQWVIINDFPLPAGYAQDKVSVAIRIETGYPRTALDMAYFYPAVSRTDGQQIGATSHIQLIDGKQYQRWSRHRTAQNPWNPAIDNLGTHVLLIEDWLEREFEK